MDGIMEKLLVALETLNSNVVLLTDATRKLAAMQVTGRRHSSLAKGVLETEQDMSRIFDELFDEDPDGEVSRAEILSHFKDCENPEVCQLIERYDLTNFRSKGYRAFIDYARTRASRERILHGGLVLSGIAMKTITYSDTLETPNPDEDFF